MKRIWKSFWGWMLCICLLLQPLPSLAMDGEAKTEQKITVSLTDGGSVKVTDPKGTESEIRKANAGEPVTFTGTKGEVFQCEAVPFEGYEVSTYAVVEGGQETSVVSFCHHMIPMLLCIIHDPDLRFDLCIPLLVRLFRTLSPLWLAQFLKRLFRDIFLDILFDFR